MRIFVAAVLADLIDQIERGGDFVSAKCVASAILRKQNNPHDIAQYWESADQDRDRDILFGLFIKLARDYILHVV